MPVYVTVWHRAWNVYSLNVPLAYVSVYQRLSDIFMLRHTLVRYAVVWPGHKVLLS